MNKFSNSFCALVVVLPIGVYGESIDAPPTADDSLEEVQVVGSRKALYTEITEDSVKLVDMPGALGDPLGAITALPGVIAPVGGGAPAVRGSSPNDNRYYIDGLPAGYIFHQFNTSVFDENVVQDFQLFSAGFGAQYSDATGAVFDVRLRDPRNQDLTTRINVSMLRSGVFIEGGVTENSAFYLSAREGMLRFFIGEGDKVDDEGFRIVDPPKDGDYQLKYQWDANDDNQLTLTLAGADDEVEVDFSDVSEFAARNPDFAGRARLDKGYDTQGLRWQTQFANNSAFNVSLANHEDNQTLAWGEGYFLDTLFANRLVRAQYTVPLGNHFVTIGGELNNREFNYQTRMVNFVCTEFDPDCQDGRGDLIEDQRNLNLRDSLVYLTDNWQMTRDFNLEVGVQRQFNDYTDEEFVHPRVAMTWQVHRVLTLTSSAGRYNRLPDIETILPLIGNPQLRSPRAEHFTLGAKGDIGQNWNWSLEAYYKELTHLPLALDADQADADQLYSTDVEGQAQGLDLLINRNFANKWYGWMSLSWSQSERTNNRSGETRDYTLDTPLVFNLVGNYSFSPIWAGGFRFTAKSGEATTKIIGVKENPDFPGRYLPEYDEPYGERLPVYSRLDIRFERQTQFWGREGSVYVDIINALNTRNTVGEDLDYEQVNSNGELAIKKSEDMGVFPSIGFSVTL